VRASFLLAVLVVACAAAPVSATQLFSLQGKVTKVTDGDTIIVRCGHLNKIVRLHGIDCPEKGQPYGAEAKEATELLCLGKTVRVNAVGYDRFKRTVGDVVVRDHGINLNQELVRLGDAWYYEAFAKNDHRLKELEEEARERHIGIWQAKSPVAPWTWRTTRRVNPLDQGRTHHYSF